MLERLARNPLTANPIPRLVDDSHAPGTEARDHFEALCAAKLQGYDSSPQLDLMRAADFFVVTFFNGCPPLMTAGSGSQRRTHGLTISLWPVRSHANDEKTPEHARERSMSEVPARSARTHLISRLGCWHAGC
jgi:hypothetical protein